jgi:hypothetical protein
MPPKSKANQGAVVPPAAAPQIQVPPDRRRPIHATLEQIQSAIEVARNLPYGPNININPNSDVTEATRFTSCIRVMSGRFIPQGAMGNPQAKTTVTFIAGEHSGVVGIFQGVQNSTGTRAFPIIDIEIPNVFPFINIRNPPITFKYTLGTLLNKALLGEHILVELQQILESLHGLSTEEICNLLNQAFERLQYVKEKEVSGYIYYCEEQLEKRIAIQGAESCGDVSAFSPEFKKDLGDFSKVFRIGAEYSPDFHGVPLKIIVFTDGPSDIYKINWSLVPTEINSNHAVATAFEEFVSNTAFNFVFNIEVIIPGHGTFVINLSLNKPEFHTLFGEKCYMLLHDLISFLRMYISSEIFKGIIIGEVLKLDLTVAKGDIISALSDMSLRIFDMGCAACRDVIDVTVTPPKYSRLVLDFFTRENTELGGDNSFNTFRLLPSLGDVNVDMLPRGINRETLSTSQIAVHVPRDFSPAVVVRKFGYNLLETGIGDLNEDSMKRHLPDTQQSELEDAPPGNYEKLTAIDIQDIIGQMNGEISGKKICLKPISNRQSSKKKKTSVDDDVSMADKNENIDKLLQKSEQILNDVNQLEQPTYKSEPPSGGVLSVFSGLANLFLRLGQSLGSRLGFGVGGGGGGIHRNITKTRNRRRKNKTKKRYRKYNKRHKKTYRLHKNHKHKIHKSHKK